MLDVRLAKVNKQKEREREVKRIHEMRLLKTSRLFLPVTGFRFQRLFLIIHRIAELVDRLIEEHRLAASGNFGEDSFSRERRFVNR